MSSPAPAEPGSLLVAALYKFAVVEDPVAFREELLRFGAEHALTGTLIVAREGLNGTVCGTPAGIAALRAKLAGDPRFAEKLSWKTSPASRQPFGKWRVKLKSEIVTLRAEGADPTVQVGTYVKPAEWNELIRRDDVVLVDTRNDYEVKLGAFEGAIDPLTENFRDFPRWVDTHLDPAKHPKVAMYCTGGIRCEKASALLLSRGFREVFHLEGGILQYLEEIPEAESTWRGECFVFDERIALKHGLAQGESGWCPHCDLPVGPDEDHRCR